MNALSPATARNQIFFPVPHLVFKCSPCHHRMARAALVEDVRADSQGHCPEDQQN